MAEQNQRGENEELALSRLKSERDALADRLAELERLSLVVGRPVLKVNDEVLQGYMALEREERRFTTHTLTQHREFVIVWYLHLTLFREAIGAYRDRVATEAVSTAHILRLQFIAAAGGTAKLALDATLAGYYTQAFALVRHLFETWVRLEFLRLNPEGADRWYMGDDGTPPQPPNEGTIHRYFRRHKEYPGKQLVEQIIGTIESLNVMAHPSQHTLQQTRGVRPTQITVGANYDADLCARALHEGAHAFRFVSAHLIELAEPPQSWRERFQEARDYLDDATRLETQRRKEREANACGSD
jgi:hypothetical protein